MSDTTYVYLIGEEDTDYVKIGVAGDPVDRRNALQTGNPRRLQILSTIPGGYELERALHQWFKKCRREGEWFDDADGAIAGYFKTHDDMPMGEPVQFPPSIFRPTGAGDSRLRELTKWWGGAPKLSARRIAQMTAVPRATAEYYLENIDSLSREWGIRPST